MIQTVPELAVRLVGKFAVRHWIFDLRPIGKEDIQPTIVVIIEHSNSAPHRLYQVLVRSGRVFVLEINFDELADIRKLHVCSGRGANQRADQTERNEPAASM